MKRFKQYLREMVADAAGGQTTPTSAQNVPAYINPTNPQYPYKSPYPTPEPADTQPNENAPPDPIDWQDLDDRFQQELGLFEDIMRLLGTMGWDAWLAMLARAYGITLTNPMDITQISIILNRAIRDRLRNWFDRTYPNSTYEQKSTFEERIRQLDDRLFEIWEQTAYPDDAPAPIPAADDDRYRPLDINDPSTWENFDPYVPNVPTSPYRQPPPNIRDDPLKPFRGPYYA